MQCSITAKLQKHLEGIIKGNFIFLMKCIKLQSLTYMIYKPELYFKYLKLSLLSSRRCSGAWTTCSFDTLSLKIVFLMTFFLNYQIYRISEFCLISFMSWQFIYQITSNIKTSKGRRGKLSLTNEQFMNKGLQGACLGLSTGNSTTSVSLFY